MTFRKPCHMPFRKLISPFTLTAILFLIYSFTCLVEDIDNSDSSRLCGSAASPVNTKLPAAKYVE